VDYVKANKIAMYYNVTLVRVRETIVAVEKQQVLHMPTACVSSRRHTACNAHAPYCQVWPARLYNVFPRYLKKDKSFGRKTLLNIKSVF
jgi:hypothetical protein